jgi:hypothetical protein
MLYVCAKPQLLSFGFNHSSCLPAGQRARSVLHLIHLHPCVLCTLLLAVNKSMSIDLAGEGVSCVLMHPGYVITEMTGGNGLIDTNTCVKGETLPNPLAKAWQAGLCG